MGLPGEGGVRAGGVPGGPAGARPGGGAARGNPAGGRPLARWDGEEWAPRPATHPATHPAPQPAAHLGTQLDELRSTSQVAYRFICTGAGVRPGPGPPGGAEPEATATAMEVAVDEVEEEAAAAEVDADDEGAWASLGGVGCCGGCCGAGCCGGDWATPEPRWQLPPPAPPGPPPATPRSAMARPGAGGPGITGIQARPSRHPGFSHSCGGDSTCLPSPPARARERANDRLHARAGPLRAVLALARRCLLRLAPPRHWVGVSGEGAGSPGSRSPHPAPRGGSRARSCPRRAVGARPQLSWTGVGAGERSGGRSPHPRSSGGSWPTPSSPPVFPSVAAGSAETPLFRGAATDRRGLPAKRPGPSSLWRRGRTRRHRRLFQDGRSSPRPGVSSPRTSRPQEWWSPSSQLGAAGRQVLLLLLSSVRSGSGT